MDMSRLSDIFAKAGTIISGLIEVGKNAEADEAALELFKTLAGKNPSDEDLDRVEAHLDEQLEKFNEDLPPSDASPPSA